MKRFLSKCAAVALSLTVACSMTAVSFADEPAGGEQTYQDGYYTTTISTDKASYGWKEAKDGTIQYGFSYPSKDYEFPVTVKIQDGKIADVAYTKNAYDIVANTGSDINYLMWAMDGHNVTDESYNYLDKEGGNYDTYHLDPHPAKNGTGLREQIIAKNGTEGVDTVTAATITSRAIIAGVNQSLEKAKTGAKDDPEPTLPEEDTSKAVIPEDGVYMGFGSCIGADLDDEKPIILYVKDGKITADLMLQQRQASYPYIYAGSEAEALEAGEAGWLYPVDYDYGYKYPGSLYHNVKIGSLDKPQLFVMHAKSSGNWFNRPITIKSEDLTKIPYGDYEADEFTFEGGSGKVEITCPKVRVTKKGIFADVQFSSSKYIKAKVGDTEYEPISTEGGSTFTLPLNVNGQTVVAGTTTAMGSEQTIEYSCTLKFDAEDLKPIAKVYQDGFYTTTVSTNKATYGWKLAKDGSTQYGFSYPSNDYDLPVTIQIKDGKIVDVAYTQDPNEVMMNTSSDFNYLLWAMNGHNVTDYSYAYLADDGNYETYHLNPYPAKNGTGLKDQIIAANGTNDVDTVTAATITSRAIIDSVDQSLEKAEKGQKDDPAPTLPTPDTSENIVPEDGVYTASATAVGISLDEDEPIVLTVKDGKMTAQVKIEQRQKTYPYIYAGTEKEALDAGESAWLLPEDYDYGYKYPGSLYKNVPFASLDKPTHFAMYAAGSGNWFNRLITIDSKSLKETAESVAEKAKAAEEAAAKIDSKSYPAKEAAAVEAAKKALDEVLAKEGATAEEIQAATKALNEAVAAAEKAKAKAAADKAAKIAAQKKAAQKMTVKGLKVTSKAKKATVKFKKTKGATAYQVQYKLKSAKKWSTLAKSTKKVKVTSKKLKKGKKYSFRVCTITKVNGATVYGKWTKAKTIKIK